MTLPIGSHRASSTSIHLDFVYETTIDVVEHQHTVIDKHKYTGRVQCKATDGTPTHGFCVFPYLFTDVLQCRRMLALRIPRHSQREHIVPSGHVQCVVITDRANGANAHSRVYEAGVQARQAI